MSKKILTHGLVALLLISLVVPATFLLLPPRASAQNATGCIGGLVGSLVGLGGSAAASVIAVPVNSIVNNYINGGIQGATWSSCINQFIIIPLIRAAIRAILQKLTATVIAWINGGNGTGHASYVSLSPHLQNVGDAMALPFIQQVVGGFQSPFGSSISVALGNNYLQQTSVAGFFGANQSTLAQSSPNVNAYLSGDFSQGGVSAWFSLTTQNQNNPYALYQAALGQLGTNVNHAVANRRQDLVQSQGFLSWCGATQNTTSAGGGVGPGTDCVNQDGTPGTIQTPGSVIHDYTQKAVVASGFDQLINANDLDSALSAIITALVNQVLGGVSGLLGASVSAGGGARSIVAQLNGYAANNTTPGTGVIPPGSAAILQAATAQLGTYSNAWQSINTAANAASTALNNLVSTCNSAVNTDNLFAISNPTFAAIAAAAAATASATANAAQNASAAIVAPVFSQVSAANAAATGIQSMIQQVQTELNLGANATADLQTLQTMPPTAADVATAVQNATATGGAAATPAGSLTISGGTIIDQMNLIVANANALQISACTPI